MGEYKSGLADIIQEYTERNLSGAGVRILPENSLIESRLPSSILGVEVNFGDQVLLRTNIKYDRLEWRKEKLREVGKEHGLNLFTKLIKEYKQYSMLRFDFNREFRMKVEDDGFTEVSLYIGYAKSEFKSSIPSVCFVIRRTYEVGPFLKDALDALIEETPKL